jgi:hypothetical protein
MGGEGLDLFVAEELREIVKKAEQYHNCGACYAQQEQRANCVDRVCGYGVKHNASLSKQCPNRRKHFIKDL